MAEDKLFGILTIDDLRARVESSEIDTVLLTFTDMYGRQLGKRLDARFFLDGAAEHGTHACDYLLTVDMNMDPVPGYRFASWERGYGDFRLAPDLATLRAADWLDRTALVVCDVFARDSDALVEVAPRSILRRQVRRAADMGYQAMAGSELEYYIFKTSYHDAAAGGLTRVSNPPAWHIEDYHVLQGTREEALNGAVRRHPQSLGQFRSSAPKVEWGKGQHELNLRFCDVVAMARPPQRSFKQSISRKSADRIGREA